MRAGRLSVEVASVRLSQTPTEPLVLEATVPNAASACTKPSSTMKWDRGVTLDLGPNCSGALRIVLRSAPSGPILAEGGTTLDWADCDKQSVPVQMSGDLNGEIELICRFFPCRTPGKERDFLGREFVDEIVVKQRSFSAKSGQASPPSPTTPQRSDESGLGISRVPLRPRWGHLEAQ